MAGIKHACEARDNQAALYLGLNVEWSMAEALKVGRVSPYTLTEKTMEFLKPLLLSQSYIASVHSLEAEMPQIYDGWCAAVSTKDPVIVGEWYRTHQEIIDLDKHHCYPVGLPCGNIFRSNFYMYPDMACDLSKRWLDVRALPHGRIVVNRTLRCRNQSISYAFLKKYLNEITFVGLLEEYEDFFNNVGRCDHILCYNAHEIAELIEGARFFIGNQSLCFSIAEALKVPRILEVCSELPNVIPVGKNAFDFLYQGPFEYYVDKLYNGKED